MANKLKAKPRDEEKTHIFAKNVGDAHGCQPQASKIEQNMKTFKVVSPLKGKLGFCLLEPG